LRSSHQTNKKLYSLLLYLNKMMIKNRSLATCLKSLPVEVALSDLSNKGVDTFGARMEVGRTRDTGVPNVPAPEDSDPPLGR
jgi:hypothetical protein